MKRKNKILLFTTIFCLLTLLAALSCVAFAEGNTESEDNADEAALTDESLTDVPKTEDGTAPATADENIFTVAFNYVKSYASEVFCALTLICSLILTYACKRGLFPAIKSGVGLMSGAVKKIGEGVESAKNGTQIAAEEITKRLKDTEAELTKLSEVVTALEGSLTPSERTLEKENTVKELLAGQINLISELVVTIAMPQKTKDRVSGKLAKLIEAMENYGE